MILLRSGIRAWGWVYIYPIRSFNSMGERSLSRVKRAVGLFLLLFCLSGERRLSITDKLPLLGKSGVGHPGERAFLEEGPS